MTQRWIVGIDGSDTAIDALRWAARHAPGRGVELTALSAFQVPPVLAVLSAKRGFGVDEIGLGATAAHDIDVALEQVAGEVEPGEVMVTPLVVEEQASHALVDASADAEMVIVGRRGGGEQRGHLFGSVSRYCVTHASCPVNVVPTGWDAAPASRIVVGFDGSDHATRAVRWALDFADDAATVTAVCAIDVAPWLDPRLTRERFADEVADQEQAFGVALDGLDPVGRIERSIVLGSPREVLTDASAHADLVVVGTRGSGGALAGVLGSVSTRLIHDASVPIMVVPGER